MKNQSRKTKNTLKTLFNTIKENTELKAAAEKDAEVLMDTLSINQVLMEEVKVKDPIIKTNESLSDVQKRLIMIKNEKEEPAVKNQSNIVKCKCDWTSPNLSQLPRHMVKHDGQYVCPKCKIGYKTKSIVCISCDKEFLNQHSLKQHLNSKHKTEGELPVGHPQRSQKQNNLSQNTACVQCDRRFTTGKEVQDHM